MMKCEEADEPAFEISTGEMTFSDSRDSPAQLTADENK